MDQRNGRSVHDGHWQRDFIQPKGSTSVIHDKFRGTKASFALTIDAVESLRALDMPIQLNMYAEAQSRPFGIKTTEAPHYRRVVMQHRGMERGISNQQTVEIGFLIGDHAIRSARGVNDGMMS